MPSNAELAKELEAMKELITALQEESKKKSNTIKELQQKTQDLELEAMDAKRNAASAAAPLTGIVKSKDVDVAAFTGKNDFNIWMYRLEQQFSMLKIPDAQRRDILLAKLDGDAIHAARQQVKSTDSYDAIVKMLTQRYVSTRPADLFMDQFYEIQQGKDENAATFVPRFRHAAAEAKKATQETLGDYAKKRRFLKALRSEYHDEVVKQCPTTFDEAAKIATSLDMYMTTRIKQVNAIKRSNITCFCCGAQGHKAARCPQRPTPKHEPDTQQDDECTCKCCIKKGRPTCTYCHKKGHSEDVCYAKKRAAKYDKTRHVKLIDRILNASDDEDEQDDMPRVCRVKIYQKEEPTSTLEVGGGDLRKRPSVSKLETDNDSAPLCSPNKSPTARTHRKIEANRDPPDAHETPPDATPRLINPCAV